MKKKLTLILSLFSTVLFAQEHYVEVESSIEEVQVFLEGAQVQRLGSTPLKAGITRLVFPGVTENIDPNSIRVSASNEVVILAVSGSKSVLSNPKRAPIIRMLEDSLEILQYELESEQNTQYVLDQQESLILSNKVLKGDKGLILIDLEDALLIYQKQLTQIKKGQQESRQKQRDLEKRIRRMRLQLEEFRKSNQQPSFEIMLTVSVPRASRMESFRINYFVKDAFWVPNYDVRVADLKSPVKLHYKADVYNNSGENWDNVKLSLSSGNPNQGGTAPVLNPQHLYFGSGEVSTYGWTDHDFDDFNTFRANYDVMDSVVLETEEAVIRVDQKNTSFSFVLPTPVKVVANNQAQSLDLMQYDLGGSFQYRSVPKLEQAAFLVCRVSGYEDLNLLIGSANIYYEGTFLGRTFIDPSITGDTLDISLGRDPSIVVERHKLKEFCSSNFSGSKKKDILVYEITVKNTKKEAVSILIEDQIPMATNKEISVEVTNISGAVYDESTGKLSWMPVVEAGQAVKYRIEFEVKYPKNKVLVGL